MPITKPRFVLAPAAVDDPVPPSATVISVIPVTVPPLIVAEVIVAVAAVKLAVTLENVTLLLVPKSRVTR